MWSVFFGLFTLAIFVVDVNDLPFLTSPLFKFPFLASYILFFLIFYFTFFQLRRVELGTEDSYYVSNYFKHFRFVYEDIQDVRMTKIIFFKVYTIRMIAKSTLGKKIRFLADESSIASFLKHGSPGAVAFEGKMNKK